MVLAAVAAFALSFTALKDQYRAQAILIETLLDKEKRLAGSETMLRKLFDAVPDIVTLTRFSDGKLFEVISKTTALTWATDSLAVAAELGCGVILIVSFVRKSGRCTSP